MDFVSKLENRVKIANSLLCIGLDPHFSQLHEVSIDGAEKFCLDIIASTSNYAAAYKPNIAFFEAFGGPGLQLLAKVIESIPEDIPIILDNKRGDIDTTAEAYAKSSYESLGADAVTLSPFMGYDSIRPFVSGAYATKGAFILCKTSNKSSREFQTLRLMNGSQLYEEVVTRVHEWSSQLSSPLNLGLVVGATDPEALKNVRHLAPLSWILCPGVGAQGGTAQDVCKTALRKDGSGVLINVSRVIAAASDKAEAARLLRDEINVHRSAFLQSLSSLQDQKDDSEGHSKKQKTSDELESYQREFIEFAIQKNVLQFGTFKLKSGRISPYFFNAGLFSCGQSLHSLGRFYATAIKKWGVEFDVIYGPAYKGIPLAAAVSMAWFQLYGESKDFAYNRKEVKDHGEGGQLVGASMAGRRVVVVDDVITAGTAIRESVVTLQHAQAQLMGVAVCLDRQEKTSDHETQSAVQQVEAYAGIPVISVVRLRHLIGHLETSASTHASAGEDLLARIHAYRNQYGVDY